MVNLNVSYDDMQREAAGLRTGLDQINQQLAAMRGRINGLVSSGFVTDSASGAFNNSYEEFNKGATQTVHGLDDMARTLESIANTLREADQSIANSIGG